MCGIFGSIGKHEVAPKHVFHGLSDIEYRGYDSWGIASWKLETGKWQIDKKTGFLPSRLDLPSSTVAVGHTRWATHGGVTKANAHPHSDCSGRIVLVHNGIVENYLELKKSLIGHQLRSETDTEIIAHLIEEELKNSKDLTRAVVKVFNMLSGLNAIVTSDGKEIIAAKVGSPLVVGQTEGGFVIASDPNALLPHTKKLLFLEDNQMVCLGEDLELFDLSDDTKKITPKFIEVRWDYSKANLENYPHFMLKEIHEQPIVLSTINKNIEQIEKVAGLIKKAYGTFFLGCGTAAYACLSGVYLFSKIAKKHINFSVGSEFIYSQDFLTPKSLLIAVSQSGESIDTLEPVKEAKSKGTKIVSLVNVLGSSLYRIADYPILLQAGVEKGVASTKALIAMFAHIILMAYSIAGNIKEGQKVIDESTKELISILKREEDIKLLAEKIKKEKNIFVLGRGLSYPIALESALKIKEVSYIHAEGFAAGELKHGVIALIEKGTPVICFVPEDETKGAILANAMEVSARGAFVIGVGPENNPVFDYFFKVKDVGASSIIPNVVFAQLLGYYLAVALGHNPDKPRNLAKSVVVR